MAFLPGCSRFSLSFLLVAFCICFHSTNGEIGLKHREWLKNWSDRLGDEIWELVRRGTRRDELKSRYTSQNTRIVKKDGKQMVREIIDSLSTMMQRKIDAVRCIVSAAEDLSDEFNNTEIAYMTENYDYTNAEKSFRIYSNESDNYKYQKTTLEEEQEHYFGIPVNLTHSAVHVPTSIYDHGKKVMADILWTEDLDNVFIQNHLSDPNLSWQYFGMSRGPMRVYPAINWTQEVNTYDCRTSAWYIQAVTCTKDIVILLDNSGSMTGKRNASAKLTVGHILDTLSNNDYVNVLKYTNETDEVNPCWQDMLVQATPENVKVFKEAIRKIKPEGYGNLTLAYIKAFALLEKYRDMRGCLNASSGVQCNQAIMVVTDGVAGNTTEVFKEWNWFENGSIPVRIFTYLTGLEVTKVREIQWMACLNRGYYTHIHDFYESREQVLKYINVMARPLVLQAEQHPAVWTHAFVNVGDAKLSNSLIEAMSGEPQTRRLSDHKLTKSQVPSQFQEDRKYWQHIVTYPDRDDVEIEFVEYKLMTSVSMPAFDRKANRPPEVNQSRVADLLGVAGTDVPLTEFSQLMLPYQVGVNGWAFIISNIGYALLHPDLRPMERGQLKVNLNSVDLTELEFSDDDENSPRYMSPEILELREALVNHSEGSMLGLKMKHHYGDMRRVALDTRDIFYGPLLGTPFSVGVSLPHDYGLSRVNPGDAILTHLNQGKHLIDLFDGSNWSLHPDWVYCRYHHGRSIEGLMMSMQEELLYFMEQIDPDFEFPKQYKAKSEDEMTFEDLDNSTETVNCEGRTIDEDSYYCDKDLLQLLIFDAKVTQNLFEGEEWKSLDAEEDYLVERYNATLRFVATQSGLTRWQYKNATYEANAGPLEFGQLHPRTIDETWYRATLYQGEHTKGQGLGETVVVSRAGVADVLTAAVAMFPPLEGGLTAPASVVGMWLTRESLEAQMTDALPCQNDSIDCYILDHSGYILVSELVNDTGRFFGEVEGAVMRQLVHEGIYRQATIYDYQSICFDYFPRRKRMSDAATLGSWTFWTHWVIAWLTWFLPTTVLTPLQIQLPPMAVKADEIPEYVDYDDDENDDISEKESDEDQFKSTVPPVKRKRPLSIHDNLEEFDRTWRGCDKRLDLFQLQPQKKSDGEKEELEIEIGCARPFFIRRVPHTSLLLVAVDMDSSSCYDRLTPKPQEVAYTDNETTHECHKLDLNALPRRVLAECYANHPLEAEITACGLAGRFHPLDHHVPWIILFLGIFVGLHRHIYFIIS